jgi:hypothetical protein
MTINCIRSTTRGAHNCYQTIVLYGCNFANGYINALRMSSYDITSCTPMKHALRVWLCSTSKSQPWARENPHAIRDNGYEVRFSVN